MNKKEEANLSLEQDLLRVVIDQLGYSSIDDCDGECKSLLLDVARSSAESGWSGFCYYNDTVRFFLKNRHLIRALLQGQYCTNEKYGAVGEVETFEGIRKDPDISLDMIAELLFGNPTFDSVMDSIELCTIANILAWWALEVAANNYACEDEIDA